MTRRPTLQENRLVNLIAPIIIRLLSLMLPTFHMLLTTSLMYMTTQVKMFSLGCGLLIQVMRIAKVFQVTTALDLTKLNGSEVKCMI